MSKLQNPNLPNYQGEDSYQRILTTKLNEFFRSIRENLNRLVDGYLFPSVTVVDDYEMTVNDSLILVDATSGAVDVTLKPAAEWKEKLVIIKKIDSSSNTVTGLGVIDGVTNWGTATQYDLIRLNSDGANIWKV